MQSHVPERLRGELARVYRDWPDCMRPVPGMEDRSCGPCRKAGAHCFVLSNASVRFPELVARFSILQRIDDRFVSAFHRLLKPSHEIYERFLSEYGLKAEECVFLDDLAGKRGRCNRLRHPRPPLHHRAGRRPPS